MKINYTSIRAHVCAPLLLIDYGMNYFAEILKQTIVEIE